MAHIQHWKRNAEQSYKFLREAYEKIKEDSLTTPGIDKTGLKIAKAQMTIYAGIYNRDYAEYKKGVDKFEKYALKQSTLKNIGLCIRTMENTNEADKAAMTQTEWLDHKLEYYKNLYNVLPKRYFK